MGLLYWRVNVGWVIIMSMLYKTIALSSLTNIVLNNYALSSLRAKRSNLGINKDVLDCFALLAMTKKLGQPV